MPECPRSWHMSCSMCPKKGRFLEPWGLGSRGFKVPGDSGTRFFLPWLSRKIVTWTRGQPQEEEEEGGQVHTPPCSEGEESPQVAGTASSLKDRSVLGK